MNLPANVSRPSWGGPLSIVVSPQRGTPASALPMPLPEHMPRPQVSEKAVTLGGRALAGIFEKRRGTGFDPYVLISWDLLTATTDQDPHTKVLASAEGDAAGWGLQWAPAGIPIAVTWGTPGPILAHIKTSLPANVMARLGGFYGGWQPHQEGHWLAQLLLPRRVPAAVSLPTPTHLHLWLYLPR